ncbi:MAG: MFS transporter [Acidobacteria bacterium]|nr:MFS transporter [Acidobacteriota bacterium]
MKPGGRRPIGTRTAQGQLGAYRDVLALVTALTLLQGAMAAVSVVMSLSLLKAGVGASGIGLVASAYSAGFLAGTLIAPLEIARIGHIRAFTLLAGVAALVALSLPVVRASVPGWAILLSLAGLAASGMLTAGESWIANAAPPQSRGAILGFYHMVSKAGAIAAPFLVASAMSGLAVFMLVAAFFIAALLPIAATNRSQPALFAASPFGPRRLLRAAPASVFAALCAGAVNNSVAQLYPVYAADFQPGDPAGFAARLNGAILIGAMLGLWPIGLLSDKLDRRLVIAGAAALGAAAAVGLAVFAGANSQGIVLLFAGIFGAGSLSYYAVAVANAADRARPEDITSMMAGILVIWGAGSIAGPPVAGALMQVLPGASGLFIFASLALGLLCVTCLSRIAISPPVPADAREPFGVSPATSLAIAGIDPRGDAQQPDLFSAPAAN